MSRKNDANERKPLCFDFNKEGRASDFRSYEHRILKRSKLQPKSTSDLSSGNLLLSRTQCL